VIASDKLAYDPAWQASVVEQSLRHYRSVRWSGEAEAAWRVIPQARHAEIEWAVDEACTSEPMSVMCQYPVRASMDVLGPASTAHGAGLRERLLQTTPLDDGGLALHGDLEVSNLDLMRSVLLAATAMTKVDQFAVDLGGLDFVDLGGIRTLLAGTAPYRRHGGQVRIDAPQAHVDRLLRLLGVHREQGVLMEALG
jgi:anti-anti-sigma factor